MGKINVPSNVTISSNVRKQITEIETKSHYDNLVSDINEFFQFVASTPTDLFGARQRGWRVEKMSTSKKESVFSIRITGGDRFAYKVDKSGEVTVLSILGHYTGTKFANVVPDFDDIPEINEDFYKDFFSKMELENMFANPEEKTDDNKKQRF